MALWTLLIVLVLALCIIAVLGGFLASQQIKADYSKATYFAEEFAEAIGKVMPELSESQKDQVLRVTEHIDDAQLARRMSESAWHRWIYLRSHKSYKYYGFFRLRRSNAPSPEDRLQDFRAMPDNELRLFTAMKPYIFALSYFDHLLGSLVRRACATDSEAVNSLAAWIFAQTKKSSPSSYWQPEKSPTV
jgi:hypothetical protein